ncbi:MAG: hypothetical protein K8T89_16850 [Planctomycetes bacterium]|nr:hypothetical protein [Planctomycetota bacterium]
MESTMPSPFDPSQPEFPQNSIDKRRLAFLLHSMKGKGATFAELKKKCRAGTGKAMKFDAEVLPSAVDALKNREWLSASSDGKVERYHITQTGTTVLESYRIYLPPNRRALLELQTENEWRHRRWTAAVLLQLFKAKSWTRTREQANDIKSVPGAAGLGLSAAIAQLIRQELVESRMLRWEPFENQERFMLTDAGLTYLTTLPFDFVKSVQMKLTGEQLNKLFTSARTANASPAVSSEVPSEVVVKSFDTAEPVVELPQGDMLDGKALDKEILAAYQHLRTEKYFKTNAVPIFEVRQRIRSRFGEQNASHEVFDRAVLDLRKEGVFRLIEMSLSLGIPAEQLQDSIPGFEETLFYMEIIP